LASVLLGSQACDERRRLARHCAIAPVANGKRSSGFDLPQ
jgi:hypothetical protein